MRDEARKLRCAAAMAEDARERAGVAEAEAARERGRAEAAEEHCRERGARWSAEEKRLQVCSHDGPIGRGKRGRVLTTGRSDAGSAS
eukprot:298080-Pyramimonas_sp.AAC.1